MRKPTLSTLSAFRNPVFLGVVGGAILLGGRVSYLLATTFGYTGTKGQWLIVQVVTVLVLILVPSGFGVLIDLGSRRDPNGTSSSPGRVVIGGLWLVVLFGGVAYTGYAWIEFYRLLAPGLDSGHYNGHEANRLFPYLLRFGFSLLATTLIWSRRKK